MLLQIGNGVLCYHGVVVKTGEGVVFHQQLFGVGVQHDGLTREDHQDDLPVQAQLQSPAAGLPGEVPPAEVGAGAGVAHDRAPQGGGQHAAASLLGEIGGLGGGPAGGQKHLYAGGPSLGDGVLGGLGDPARRVQQGTVQIQGNQIYFFHKNTPNENAEYRMQNEM